MLSLIATEPWEVRSRWAQGPTSSRTGTPRPASVRYCSRVCSMNRSCQPPTSSTGTVIRSSAGPHCMGAQNGSLACGCSIHRSDQAGSRPITSAYRAATGRLSSTRRSLRSAVAMRAIARSIPVLSWCATRSLHMT